MNKKPFTLGKKLGLAAFIFSEILVSIMIAALFIIYFLDGLFDFPFAGQILFFQGTIFSVSWGAKASSNFAKKNNHGELDEMGPN